MWPVAESETETFVAQKINIRRRPPQGYGEPRWPPELEPIALIATGAD